MLFLSLCWLCMFKFLGIGIKVRPLHKIVFRVVGDITNNTEVTSYNIICGKDICINILLQL